jgi:two-component system nitrate/nitrite response regulator NarL
MIRILIADDHQLFAESLALGITAISDLVVVATASNGREALQVLKEQQIDVLVLDLEMPEVDGLTVLRSQRHSLPSIVVTMHASDEQRSAAFAAGAAAFLPKSTPLGDLAAAIRAVNLGMTLRDKTTMSDILSSHSQPVLDDVASSLTARERELLTKMAEGLTSTPELAEALYISEKTVKNHLASIYHKLSVSDRASAVVEALNRGIVQTSP